MPPPPVNHAGDDGAANLDAAKEINDLVQQPNELLKQAEQLTANAPVSHEQIDVLKARALKLATDDRFLKSAEELWKSEKRKKMLAIQLAWFLFMTFFKSWRQSRTPHWFKRVLVGFACSVLTWVGLSYVIPAAVLGEPFLIFTGTLWRVLVTGG